MAGISTKLIHYSGIAVSWYAAEVAQSWGNPMLMQGGFGGGFGGGIGTGGRVVSNEYISNDRYVLGWALFIGKCSCIQIVAT